MAAKKSTGRPEYEPSDQDRQTAKVLRAAGKSQAVIAAALRISVPTLIKHLSFELQTGGAETEAEIIMARYRAAMGGNVQAQTRLLEQIRAARAEESFTAPSPTKAPKLGKKEQAAAAAETAGDGTEWGNDLADGTTVN